MTDPGRLTELSAARYSAKVSGTGNPLPGSGHPGFDRLGCPLPAKTLRAPDPARDGDPLRPSGSYGRIVDSNKNNQFLFFSFSALIFVTPASRSGIIGVPRVHVRWLDWFDLLAVGITGASYVWLVTSDCGGECKACDSTRMVVLACACAALSGWFGGTRGGMPQSAGVSRPVDMGELETKSGLPLGFTNCFLQISRRARLRLWNKVRRETWSATWSVRSFCPVADIPLPAPFPAFIWTDGPTFHAILSSSSSDIL